MCLRSTRRVGAASGTTEAMFRADPSARNECMLDQFLAGGALPAAASVLLGAALPLSLGASLAASGALAGFFSAAVPADLAV